MWQEQAAITFDMAALPKYLSPSENDTATSVLRFDSLEQGNLS